MPELPEVETIRRQLAPLVEGRTLARVEILDPRWSRPLAPAALAAALEGRRIERLGLEPLDERFTAAHLRELTRARRAPIKALLLDQRRVAGVGNIYADEALFMARIHPLRAAGALSAKQRASLREALVQALGAGIDARGASIDDFRHVDGVRGAFQEQFLVYGRAGEPCVRCGHEIVRTVVAGRGTFVCEHCQRRPRAGPRPRSARTAAAGSRSDR